MTFRALLCMLVDDGIGVAITDQGLDVDGPPGTVTADVVAALTEYKIKLLHLLDATRLRVHFQVPADHVPINPTLAVVMARLAMERGHFTDAERAAYDARVVERQATEKPYLARLFAIEDIVRARGHGMVALIRAVCEPAA